MADERRNGHTTEKRLAQNRQRASGRSGRRASEQWRKRQQRYRVISWILTAVFMVIFYALICACVGNRKLYKKTTINGLDVGGMKSAEAAKSINDQFRRDYSSVGIQVKLDDKTYTLDVSAALDMDSEKSVQKIQDDSHSFWRRGYGLLESWTLGSSYDIYPYIGDSGIITTAIESSDMMKVDLDIEDGYRIEDKNLIVTKGKGSYRIDTDKLVTRIKKQIAKGDYGTVVECPVVSADVDLDEVYKKVHCEPQNPTLDPDKNYEVVEAKDGVDFDLEAAKKSLESAKKGTDVSIPLTYTPADMSTEEYRKMLFRDEMSSYSTEVEGSENRKTNVKLAAQYCRTVYEAGFSPICPTLYQPLFLNDAVPEEHKSGIDMGRDLLRRSHVLVVCGHTVTEAMKNDIAVAQRLGITATTLEGILTVKGQGRR